jgi:transcription antitermination factor NusG
MSSGGPPTPPPLPAFGPGDRIRILTGLFAGIVGTVLGPDPVYPIQPAVRVRMNIWGRNLEVGIAVAQIEQAPPD